MEKLKTSELEEKLKSAENIILDFGSPGCVPCKKVPPIIEEALGELGDKDVKAYYVDIVEEAEVAQKYFVFGVPTVIIFKSGEEVARFTSVPKKAKIVKAIS